MTSYKGCDQPKQGGGSKPPTEPEDVEMAESGDAALKYGVQPEEADTAKNSKEKSKATGGATSIKGSSCKVSLEGKGLDCLPHSKRERMARKLDDEYSANKNWKDLARALAIDPAIIARVDYTRDTRRPTEALFMFLKFSRPKLSLAEFMEAARKVSRQDIVDYVTTIIENEEKIGPKSYLSKVGEKYLHHITHLVSDCHGQPGHGWRGFAEALKINTRMIDQFEHERTRVRRDYSPTMELLHALKARQPKNTLQSLSDALKAIGRFDVDAMLDE